ncbi:MAG: PIN domain nuclease [Sphingobacteriales bacterium]|jgi:predicted nucleic acid-binding protein|nr:MAG: PIN domain nuclease [Sphingobacteriales bacterium]
MLLISDSNIIISAIVSPNGTISNIIHSKRKFKIIAPEFLKVEINRHKEKILKLTGYSVNEYELIYKELIANIQFVDTNGIPKYYTQKAFDLVKDIDLDDLEFVELALYKRCLLWTVDRSLVNGLKKKGFTKIITTSELRKFLYKK